MAKPSYLIAVVDDEESVRRALGRLIAAAGFDVQTFCCGADFLLWAAQQRPHCVVLDLRMPQMNGFEVQQALAPSLPPVIVITGDDSADSRSSALRHGASACLRKPVDETMLLDAIERAVQRPPLTAV
jgi:FixJ family two-component response regulator